MSAPPSHALSGARALAIFDDSITTDHISPAGAIKAVSPAGDYLRDHKVSPPDFNSYGARRGNHEVMVRGTFANVRTEMSLQVLAYNLKRVISILGISKTMKAMQFAGT